jgi:hypothetical protein
MYSSGVRLMEALVTASILFSLPASSRATASLTNRAASVDTVRSLLGRELMNAVGAAVVGDEGMPLFQYERDAS